MNTTETLHFLDEERKRQGLTKKQLADKSGLPGTSVRRIFSARPSDMRLSTLNKLAEVLAVDFHPRKVDDGYTESQSRHLLDRIRRQRLAERLAEKSGLDAGDIEHSLYNLTLTFSERLKGKIRK